MGVRMGEKVVEEQESDWAAVRVEGVEAGHRVFGELEVEAAATPFQPAKDEETRLRGEGGIAEVVFDLWRLWTNGS